MTIKDHSIEWYRNNKFMIGVVLVIISIILGFWGKVLIIVRFYEPIELLTGISIYAFSFVLLFTGILLVGWQTVRMIQYKIHHHVRKTVKKTYHHARKFPKRARHYTKELHKKGIEKIRETIKTSLAQKKPKK